MSKYNSKYLLSLIASIVLLFALSTVIVLVYKRLFYNQGNVNPNNVVFEGDTNIGFIKNRLPVTDKFGKSIQDDNAGAFTYMNFKAKNITSKKQNYQVYVTRKSVSGKSINSRYLKFYLTDDKDVPFKGYDNNVIPSFVDLKYLNDFPDSKLVYSGFLESSEEQNLRLRVWIVDNYVIPDKEEAFSFEVSVRAI